MNDNSLPTSVTNNPLSHGESKDADSNPLAIAPGQPNPRADLTKSAFSHINLGEQSPQMLALVSQLLTFIDHLSEKGISHSSDSLYHTYIAAWIGLTFVLVAFALFFMRSAFASCLVRLGFFSSRHRDIQTEAKRIARIRADAIVTKQETNERKAGVRGRHEELQREKRDFEGLSFEQINQLSQRMKEARGLQIFENDHDLDFIINRLRLSDEDKKATLAALDLEAKRTEELFAEADKMETMLSAEQEEKCTDFASKFEQFCWGVSSLCLVIVSGSEIGSTEAISN